MEDLQLTKEFEEAIAAISNDIAQNPQKYKQAGEWLDQYYDKDFCQKKMQKRSEMLLSEVFAHGIKQNEYYCPVWHRSGSPPIKAYEVLQAVAMNEFNHFASMGDILERDPLFGIPAGSLTCQMATDIVASRYGSKMYPALKDRLWLAYKEMLEIKEQCKFLGQEESVRVCLLTWLLANPDANKTTLGITEFDKWEWYSLYESGVCTQRADVIKLLHTCKMLTDWQNLAYEAWQNIKNFDSEIERPTKTERLHKTASGNAGDTPVTLREFVRDYCEPVSENILESRVKSLQSLAQREEIVLEHTGNWESGQSKKYLPSYLVSNWQTYSDKLGSLPKLKQA